MPILPRDTSVDRVNWFYNFVMRKRFFF